MYCCCCCWCCCCCLLACFFRVLYSSFQLSFLLFSLLRVLCAVCVRVFFFFSPLCLLAFFGSRPLLFVVYCVSFNTHTAFLRHVFTTPKQSVCDRREVTIVLAFGGVILLALNRSLSLCTFFNSVKTQKQQFFFGRSTKNG